MLIQTSIIRIRLLSGKELKAQLSWQKKSPAATENYLNELPRSKLRGITMMNLIDLPPYTPPDGEHI